jgi:hypothetical protein
MFDLISRFAPPWLASALTGIWFALSIWAIFFASMAQDVDFRYWRM